MNFQPNALNARLLAPARSASSANYANFLGKCPPGKTLKKVDAVPSAVLQGETLLGFERVSGSLF
jgi:hypothetical protein